MKNTQKCDWTLEFECLFNAQCLKVFGKNPKIYSDGRY